MVSGINGRISVITGSGSINKRFGSEPDLRIEEEQKTKSGNRHFRKKYRAPPPPTHDVSNPSHI